MGVEQAFDLARLNTETAYLCLSAKATSIVYRAIVVLRHQITGAIEPLALAFHKCLLRRVGQIVIAKPDRIPADPKLSGWVIPFDQGTRKRATDRGIGPGFIPRNAVIKRERRTFCRAVDVVDVTWAVWIIGVPFQHQWRVDPLATDQHSACGIKAVGCLGNDGVEQCDRQEQGIHTLGF